MAASEPTFSSSDPTSSLRAAALSTIKRKKPQPASAAPSGPSGKPLLARIPVVNAIQLDYGQEENAPPPPAPQEPLKAQDQRAPQEIDQNREEGEISDSEDSLPVPALPKVQPPPTPTVATAVPSKSLSRLTLSSGPPTSRNRTDVTPPPRSAIPKVESPAGPNLLDRISDMPQPSKPVPSQHVLDEVFSQLDEDHVRPGLAMNQSQYDTAKDIVLDLLGWGVAPEFLVDCGLSRELVFYVFSELSLRLPTNFDPTGLIPYPPYPQMLNMSIPWSTPTPTPTTTPQAPIIKSEPSLSDLSHTPTNSPPAISRKVAALATNAINISRSGLSPPQYSPSTSNTPVSSSDTANILSPSSGSLLDMERQRRQELLARKAAVQASRKSKQAPRQPSAPEAMESSSSNTSAKENTKPGPPAELSVEDFLNSIAPSSATSSSESTVISEPSRRRSSPEAMDVDQPPILQTPTTLELPASEPPADDILPSLPSPNEPPPSTASSSSTSKQTSFEAMQDTPPSDGGYSHTVRPQTNPEPPPRPLGRSATLQSLTTSSVAESSKLGSGSSSQRRGTKRPVAADFVDFDTSEGQNRRAEWNPPVPPAQSPKVPHDRAIRRRLTGSNGSIMSSGMGFASVSGMRPCIIDLSDSDDDGTEDRNHLVFRPDARSRYSPALPGARNQRVVGTSGRGTPSTSAPSTGISSQASSASLLEKEEQIRKMKELIARAEQKQQQKQAITRSASVLPESSRGVTPSVESSTVNAVDGQSAVMVDPEAGMSDASTPTEQPPRSQTMDSPMIGPLFFPSSIVLNVN